MKNAANFTDRLQEQAKAKQALLNKFKQASEDPEAAKRRAERAGLSKARDEKRALAEMVRKERIEEERKARDELRRKAAEAAEEKRLLDEAAADIARAEAAARQRMMLSRQKAALDARNKRRA